MAEIRLERKTSSPLRWLLPLLLLALLVWWLLSRQRDESTEGPAGTAVPAETTTTTSPGAIDDSVGFGGADTTGAGVVPEGAGSSRT
jgi:hypothetical protein